MGRYKFDKFLMRFSKDAQNAIIKDLVECCDICVDDYDWNVIDVRVKKADQAQRHRFADTITKLDAFVKSDIADPYKILTEEGKRDICVSASFFARITGRNRKTVTDWINKEFIVTDSNSMGLRRLGQPQFSIMIRKTIEKLKQM
nr:hypothetical protein [uncultured Alistipes sp.]